MDQFFIRFVDFPACSLGVLCNEYRLDKLVQLIQVQVGEDGTQHASYNVAKKVVGFEFEERIPRTRLCSAYGDGFKGAPLRCTPQSKDALPRDSSIGDGNSIT